MTLSCVCRGSDPAALREGGKKQGYGGVMTLTLPFSRRDDGLKVIYSQLFLRDRGGDWFLASVVLILTCLQNI